jgi:hypothetical protein
MLDRELRRGPHPRIMPFHEHDLAVTPPDQPRRRHRPRTAPDHHHPVTRLAVGLRRRTGRREAGLLGAGFRWEAEPPSYGRRSGRPGLG